LWYRCHSAALLATAVALVVAAEPWLDQCRHQVELVEWVAVEGPMAWVAGVRNLIEKSVAVMLASGRMFVERGNRVLWVGMRCRNSFQHNERSPQVLAHSYHRTAPSNKALALANVQPDHREQVGSSCQLQLQGWEKRWAGHKWFDMEAQGEERPGGQCHCQGHLERV
jgi:hypothetical protein